MPYMHAIRAKHKFLPPFMHIKITIFLFDTRVIEYGAIHTKYVECAAVLCIESSAMRLKKRKKRRKKKKPFDYTYY